MIFLTYQAGARASDLRTVVLAGKPRVNAATGTLTAELAEGTYSAARWWAEQVFEREYEPPEAFEMPVEYVRKVRVA